MKTMSETGVVEAILRRPVEAVHVELSLVRESPYAHEIHASFHFVDHSNARLTIKLDPSKLGDTFARLIAALDQADALQWDATFTRPHVEEFMSG